MPELAEVEVVRDVLEKSILNTKILDIECFYEPILETGYEEFKAKLINKSIIKIERLGKYLIFILEDIAFISHLRMEGKYFYLRNDEPISKHTHVVFHFENGYKLVYQDVRKFGRMELKEIEQVYSSLPLSKLGVEANANTYDANEILNKINKKNLPIKTVLLDQSIISGLGNIYVDEVLFKSNINPYRLAKDIDINDVNNIMKHSKEILDKAILLKGTTIRSYTSSLGVKGGYQDFLNVHTKTICPNCGNILNKDKIGGRSSYYCNKCQEV